MSALFLCIVAQYSFTSPSNGIRISVQRSIEDPKMEHSRDHSDTESDTELSNIEFTQHVNLRDKRPGEDRVPRPMSWEGGLSDDDMDTIEVTIY